MTQYNRNVKFRVCGALLLAVLLVSCNNGMRTREAVERDIRKSVGRRGDLNMNNLDVTVNSVNFHGNKADAVVGFMPKGGLISQGMTMRYTLEQRGNEWVIVNRQMGDMHAHTGASGTPGSAPGNSAEPLPPGHPSLDGNPK
jgi:hypothetical protein